MPKANREPVQALVPYWQSECGRAVVYVGDCRDVMAQMEPEQFHAVVTDPPYGLEFMGKAWDAPWKRVDARSRRASELDDPVKAKYLRHNVEYVRDSYLYQEWFLERAVEMLRVTKPGAYLLSFGGTRMWHRMACAVEDAGWEVRDTIMWVYGSGFPKSMDISKQLNNMAGADRTIVGTKSGLDGSGFGNVGHGLKSTQIPVTEPTTDAAKQWSGFGTALKPAVEPIAVARKPFQGTVAQCVLDNGCGGINVDGCRVGNDGGCKIEQGDGGFDAGTINALGGHLNSARSPSRAGLGRWPANLVMSHHLECKLVGTRASKDRTTPGGLHRGSGHTVGSFTGQHDPIEEANRPDEEVWECHPDCPCRMLDEQSGRTSSRVSGYGVHFGDSGGASRYFYTAKADSDDRPHGKGATTHPTVKPLDLMRYLVRLVCAKGGTVLDPFMGSGSTGCAAIAEGMKFVGIEQSQEYADIAVGRLRLALSTAPPLEELRTHGAKVVAGQVTAPTPRRLRG